MIPTIEALAAAAEHKMHLVIVDTPGAEPWAWPRGRLAKVLRSVRRHKPELSWDLGKPNWPALRIRYRTRGGGHGQFVLRSIPLERIGQKSVRALNPDRKSSLNSAAYLRADGLHLIDWRSDVEADESSLDRAGADDPRAAVADGS